MYVLDLLIGTELNVKSSLSSTSITVTIVEHGISVSFAVLILLSDVGDYIAVAGSTLLSPRRTVRKTLVGLLGFRNVLGESLQDGFFTVLVVIRHFQK
jgi:hypothetical protein